MHLKQERVWKLTKNPSTHEKRCVHMHGCSPALPSAAQTAGGVNREAHLKKRGKLKSSNALQQPGHHSYASSFSNISNICLIENKSLHSSKRNFKSEQRYGYFTFVQHQMFVFARLLSELFGRGKKDLSKNLGDDTWQRLSHYHAGGHFLKSSNDGVCSFPVLSDYMDRA